MTHDSVSEEQRLNEWNETPSADKVRGLMMRLVEESRKIVDEKDAERFRLYVGSIGLLMVRESMEREQAVAENAARAVLVRGEAELEGLSAMAHSAYLNLPKEDAGDMVNQAMKDAIHNLWSAAAPFLKGK